MRRAPALLIVCAAAVLGAAGCGEEGGVASGATVRAYVAAPLCAGAQRALAKDDGQAGSVRVAAVCLPDSRQGGRQDLATVGASARRVTEDSASVAYLETPTTPSFSRPIVEAAEIPVIRTSSGEAAMEQLLSAIADADSGSLRDAVREALN